jgi:hypothetical protein
VRRCRQLIPDWLPVDARATLRCLDVSKTLLQVLPEGLCALQELNVSKTLLQHLPEGLCALEELNVSHCSALRGLAACLQCCARAHPHCLGVHLDPTAPWTPHADAACLRQEPRAMGGLPSPQLKGALLGPCA